MPCRYVLAALAATALAASSPAGARVAEPPAEAFASTRLRPIPERVLTQCRLMQAQVSFPFLCPRRLPRATIPPRPGLPLPRLGAERQVYRDLGGVVSKIDFHYGAPYPRRHWRNRPCCFLHFELLRRPPGPQAVPSGAYPAVLGGRQGLLKPAYDYDLACGPGDRHLYWCNHVAFLWRERGVDWVATLHYFGPKETRRLLARLVSELRPVSG